VCSECSNCDSDDADLRLDCPENIPPGCGFCSVPNTWGSPRSRSIDTIVKEIEDLLILGARRIVLEAPDFLDYHRGSFPLTDPCSPPANVQAIRELLVKINELEWIYEERAHLSIENIKACLFSEEVARLLSELLPATSPNIGLETGSAYHSSQIGKCGSPKDVVRAVRLTIKYQMSPYIYFIYGLPEETEKTVNESIEMMELLSEIGAERIILYGFRALPGSAFAEFPEPSSKYELGKRMQEAARMINRRKKDDYVGKEIRVVVSEPSWTKSDYTMVYPLGEGPLMTVQGKFNPGELLTVRIIRVLSPGLLEAEVLKQ
jgi:radical SAM superfamily enzyme YgiQ (UPF0313 family)